MFLKGIPFYRGKPNSYSLTQIDWQQGARLPCPNHIRQTKNNPALTETQVLCANRNQRCNLHPLAWLIFNPILPWPLHSLMALHLQETFCNLLPCSWAEKWGSTWHNKRVEIQRVNSTKLNISHGQVPLQSWRPSDEKRELTCFNCILDCHTCLMAPCLVAPSPYLITHPFLACDFFFPCHIIGWFQDC